MPFKKSEELLAWLVANTSNFELSVATLGEKRVRAGVACLHLAMETHEAILVLLKKPLVGVAAALVRVIVEAYVRGAWILYCATDEQVNKWVDKDEREPTFREMVLAIEAHPGFRGSELSRLVGRAWNAMNSYTHCGALQITRLNTIDGVEPNYTIEECQEFLRLADGMALAAAGILAELAGKEELSRELLAKVKELP